MRYLFPRKWCVRNYGHELNYKDIYNMVFTDEVTDKTPGAISKPVSFPVRKPHEIGEEIGEEDDVELAELRIKMEQTNKMWEETFKRSEKERLKQEISQKEKQIKAYRKKGEGEKRENRKVRIKLN